MLRTAGRSAPGEPRDERALLRGVGWALHEAIEAARGERDSPRLTYREGDLERMRPSKAHDTLAGMIGRLLTVHAEERIAVHVLRDGAYARGDGSLLLPDLDLVPLAACCERPDRITALREHRAALRRAKPRRREGARSGRSGAR